VDQDRERFGGGKIRKQRDLSAVREALAGAVGLIGSVGVQRRRPCTRLILSSITDLLLIVIVIIIIMKRQHQRLHGKPADVVADDASIADCGAEMDAAVDARVVRLVRRGREAPVSTRAKGAVSVRCVNVVLSPKIRASTRAAAPLRPP
jgi:hypothetical protein